MLISVIIAKNRVGVLESRIPLVLNKGGRHRPQLAGNGVDRSVFNGIDLHGRRV
jgi:hypothetical protein